MVTFMRNQRRSVKNHALSQWRNNRCFKKRIRTMFLALSTCGLVSFFDDLHTLQSKMQCPQHHQNNNNNNNCTNTKSPIWRFARRPAHFGRILFQFRVVYMFAIRYATQSNSSTINILKHSVRLWVHSSHLFVAFNSSSLFFFRARSRVSKERLRMKCTYCWWLYILFFAYLKSHWKSSKSREKWTHSLASLAIILHIFCFWKGENASFTDHEHMIKNFIFVVFHSLDWSLKFEISTIAWKWFDGWIIFGSDFWIRI